MKLEFVPTPGNEPSRAVLTHQGYTLDWNAQLFDRASYKGDFDVFEQINHYWAKNCNPDEQDKIFGIYTQIWNVFENDSGEQDLTEVVRQLVTQLFEFHPLERMEHFLRWGERLPIPSSITRGPSEQRDANFSRDRTYGPEEYAYLRALAVTLRIMIPVWGQFIHMTRRDTGNTFKEYQAYQLLAYTNLERSQAMEKLKVFVTKSLPPDKSRASAILKGLSNDDFPIWMLALVLIRRLSVGDVRGEDQASNLITFIYRYIDHKARTHDNSFEGTVKEKQVEGAGQDGENNLSKLEGYKMKPELPQGDIVFINTYAEDPLWLARQVAPEIPEELVVESINSVQVLVDQELHKPQITLVQWMLADVIRPRGIWLLSKPLTLNTIAATQALFWYGGWYELAALVSAMKLPDEEGHMAVSPDNIKRANVELQDKLAGYYPYMKRATNKQKQAAPQPSNIAGIKQKAPKQISVVREAVESVAGHFSRHAWRLTLPAEMVEKLKGNRMSRRYSVPADLRVRLAEFILTINERQARQQSQ